MKMIYHFLLCMILFSCNPTHENQFTEVSQSQVVVSANGAVATAHPLATRAAVDILEQGGNAIDAAVAAAFTLSVVEPSMSGLGGRLQAIVRRSDGSIYGVDATTQAGLDYDPETAPRASFGYPVIGVPGVVKGLDKLMKDHGSVKWEKVLTSAIMLAEGGFELLPGEARRQGQRVSEIMEFDGSRKYFISGDSTYHAGALFVQKDLAETLRILAEKGGDDFYNGDIARKIVEDVTSHGGTLSLEALSSYEARDAEIVQGNYRGYDLHGLYMPSYGAITIEMLHIMENFDLSENNSNWMRWVFEANRRAYMDRRNQDKLEDALKLIDKDYAALQAESIQAGLNSITEDEPVSFQANGHTTHLSVADKEGNMIALTQSLGPNMGSRVATDGLGFLYATTLGGYLGDFQPGQRASSHISPFILTKDGQPFMVLGAAGGSRIITAIVQSVSRVIDHKMTLEEALGSGRIHSGDTLVLVETHPGTFTPDEVRGLAKLGYRVEEIDQPGRFGRVHAIMFDPQDSTWIGAADPDWEGTAASPTFPEK